MLVIPGTPSTSMSKTLSFISCTTFAIVVLIIDAEIDPAFAAVAAAAVAISHRQETIVV